MNWYLMVLKNYAGFDGRARRKEYWMFYLIHMLISIALGALGGVLDFIYLGNIYTLAVLCPIIAVSIRRMHDTNHSGWFILVAPLYNLYLLCINGDVGENQYGSDPKREGSFNEDALDSHMTN